MYTLIFWLVALTILGLLIGFAIRIVARDNEYIDAEVKQIIRNHPDRNIGRQLADTYREEQRSKHVIYYGVLGICSLGYLIAALVLQLRFFT